MAKKNIGKVAGRPMKIPGELICPHNSNDSEQAEISRTEGGSIPVTFKNFKKFSVDISLYKVAK